MSPAHPFRPLLAAAVLSATTPAFAVTSDAFEYDAARVGYLSIPATALAPNSDESAADYFMFSNPPSVSTAVGGCYNTGINLPQGASLVSVQVWYASGETSNPIIGVFRSEHGAIEGETLVNQQLFDDFAMPGSVTLTVPGPLRIVKNGVYVYELSVCLTGPGTTFYSARIRYTYRNAGD